MNASKALLLNKIGWGHMVGKAGLSKFLGVIPQL